MAEQRGKKREGPKREIYGRIRRALGKVHETSWRPETTATDSDRKSGHKDQREKGGEKKDL